MNRRSIELSVFGALIFGSALAVSYYPTLLSDLGITELLAQFENAYLLTATAGLIVFSWGAVSGMTWTIAGINQTTLPAVEEVTGVETPGSELDEAVPELIGDRGRAARNIEHRDRIQERLRIDAINTLVRTTRLKRNEAEEAVATGDWTDDPFATDFLGESDAPGPTALQRLRRRLFRKHPFEIRVERSIDAIRALEEADSDT